MSEACLKYSFSLTGNVGQTFHLPLPVPVVPAPAQMTLISEYRVEDLGDDSDSLIDINEQIQSFLLWLHSTGAVTSTDATTLQHEDTSVKRRAK